MSAASHEKARNQDERSIGRACADTRVSPIFGGSSEIMKEIITRTL